MKKILLIISCFTLLANAANAQNKKKAAAQFVKELNNILTGTPYQHWNYKGKMTVDSAFAINAAGILSVTVRYTTDSSFVRVRMEAPVSKIIDVAYDLYLILEYKNDDVIIYESYPGSNLLKEVSRFYLFHIGEPNVDGYYQKEKLQKLLRAL